MHRITRICGLFTLILAFVGATVCSVDGQDFLTNGLVAYYPLNGNANDMSGNGNNGVVSGALNTSDRFGKANSALYFSGNNGVRIQVSGGPAFALSNLTYSAWLRTTNFSEAYWQDQRCVVSMIAPTVSYGGAQLVNDRYRKNLYVEYRTLNSSNFRLSTADGTFNTNYYNRWVHIVSTLSTASGSVTASLYVNGALAASTNFVSGPPAYNGQSCYIGANCDWASSVREFLGDLDDARIYNRAMPASEVAQLYTIEAGLLNIHKAVYLDTGRLTIGWNYQLQVSSDLSNWTNQGAPFTATDSYWRSTNYWDVENWDQLFFRLQPVP